VEIWAYGAPVLQSGGKGLNQWGMRADAHNAPKVNGYGVLSTTAINAYNSFPNAARVGEIIAFTNHADFFYACADLSGAYTNSYNPNASNLVLSMKRHVILSKTGKSFLIYDENVNRTAAELAVNFPIQQQMTNQTPTNFIFSSTNKSGVVVTTYVFQVVSGFSLTNRAGAQGLTNPVTGAYTADTGGESVRFSHNMWYRKITPAVTNASLAVFVPQQPGKSAPTFLRLDNTTVAVTYDGVTETNTFGTNYAGAFTYRVELAEASSGDSGGGSGGGSEGPTNGVRAARVQMGTWR
jgi:hypothetical protein